ncbi:MAG: N-succinylarginine dihydrolase [Polyangiaceae bacterium]|nr:N-succinylarginine dihydrolase [Polyangiaceae bacterium]
MTEVSFDGLVGPTHNFGGLSPGNVASEESRGMLSNPRAAALQGIDKMRAVADLGVAQAVLPPQPRPSLSALRLLGFEGTPDVILARAAKEAPHLLRLVSSASSMWAANAATVAPAPDTIDGRLHVVPANLEHMFHRSIEAETTHAVLSAIFRDASRFAVHAPLPGAHFADEGAANHTRLVSTSGAAIHVFAWGRRAFGADEGGPRRYPARQTREASEALARLLAIPSDKVLFPRQHPEGIDAGAFHTDVLAVGHRHFFMAHELAFVDGAGLAKEIDRRSGGTIAQVWAKNDELPVGDAVAAYPFNSQVVTARTGDRDEIVIVAPVESRENPRARAFLERVVAEDNPVSRVVYIDVGQSMRNGGGPACLRQRVSLRRDDLVHLGARVLFDEALESELRSWVARRYRDRLSPEDLADPALFRESAEALDELTRILGLGSVYDFQK